MRGGLIFRQINPLTKLGAALLFIGYATITFDARGLGLLLAAVAIVLAIAERIAPLALARTLLPFALAGFGFFWTHLLFSAQADSYAQSLPQFDGGLTPFAAGLAMFLRAMCFGTFSYFFVRTTDPGDLVRALIQHMRLPPHLAFSVFAAVQLLPTLHSDLRQIELAHALKTGRVAPSRRWSLFRYTGYAIPLLASTMRRATRAAISMECRGLAPGMNRTSLHKSVFSGHDVVFSLGAVALLTAIILAV